MSLSTMQKKRLSPLWKNWKYKVLFLLGIKIDFRTKEGGADRPFCVCGV